MAWVSETISTNATTTLRPGTNICRSCCLIELDIFKTLLLTETKYRRTYQVCQIPYVTKLIFIFTYVHKNSVVKKYNQQNRQVLQIQIEIM